MVISKKQIKIRKKRLFKKNVVLEVYDFFDVKLVIFDN